uniref:Protein draper-like n=1 Tax=Crassostrea virginica TaxID=6565 RepID=A0A8B8BGC9_CRAVI|nr:protein draper-like [Crassostrea virginica]
MNKFVSAILTAITLSYTYGNIKPGFCKNKDKRDVCCTNYYRNGTDCVECPDGYIGENCSTSCPSGQYGAQCNKKCSCSDSQCHHVYGCTLTTLIKRLTPCSDGYTGENCSTVCPPKQYGSRCGKTCNCTDSSCHHVYGCNFTRANKEKSEEKNTEEKSGTKSDSKYRIIIIMSGTLLSITLLFLIGRKIYKFLKITQIHGEHPSQSDAPNVDNVYAEINQSSRSRLRN